MTNSATNAFFSLLFGAISGGNTGDCQPYLRPSHLAADLNLTSPLTTVPHLAADDHLCEELV